MELSSFLANTIWMGSFPYGFRLFGLHVVAELPLEAFVIWKLIQKREHFRWLFGRVLLANVGSFFAGTLALGSIWVPKYSEQGESAVWVAAFAISWVVECFFLQRWLQAVPRAQIWKATFWGNVASYLVAVLVFLAWRHNFRVPWPTIHG